MNNIKVKSDVIENIIKSPGLWPTNKSRHCERSEAIQAKYRNPLKILLKFKSGLLHPALCRARNDEFANIMFLFLFLFLLPITSHASAPLEKQATTLYQEVRCPVCLGQSIADSEMEESQALKAFILENLKRGESEEHIREKLRTMYGDEILLRPPFDDHTLFLWFAPFGLFLLIALAIGWKWLNPRQPNSTVNTSPPY